MCRVLVSFCEVCNRSWITGRMSCGPNICNAPENICDRPRLCNIHTRALTYPAAQHTSHSVTIYEPVEPRNRRDEARKKEASLHDIQSNLACSEAVLKQVRKTVEGIEISKHNTIGNANHALRYTLAQVEGSRIAWAKEKSGLEATISKEKDKTATAMKETGDAKNNLKKKEEELQAVKKSLSKAAEALNASVRKDEVTKQLKKQLRKSLYGRR